MTPRSRARSKSPERISKRVIPPIIASLFSWLADRNVHRIPEDVRFGVLLVAPVDRERHGQILHGETRRVEDRDLLVRPAPLLGAEQDVAKLGDVLAPDRPCRKSVAEVAIVARLLPLVADDPGPRQLAIGDLGLAWPIRAHQADVLAWLEVPVPEHRLVPGRDGDDDAGRPGLRFAGYRGPLR